MTEQKLFKPTTKNGYKLDEVTSALQKDIRRQNTDSAIFWAMEFLPFFHNYLWKRLTVISAEDIEDPLATQIVLSHRGGFYYVNEKKSKEDYQSFMFILKVVTYLCRAVKTRESDHSYYWYKEILSSGNLPKIPDYALDVHTAEGRKKGMTKKQFFIDEQEGLDPKGRDDYFDKIKMIHNE